MKTPFQSGQKLRENPTEHLQNQADSHESQSRGSWFGERWWGGMPLSQLSRYCQRVGIGLRSGVDILRILEAEKKLGSSKHRQIAAQMQSDIRSGSTLSDALKNAGVYFPPLLIQMVSSGELAGGMDRMFERMGAHYHDLRQTRKNFWGQLTLPLIQLGLALLVITGVIYLQGILSRSSNPEEQFDALGLGLKGGSGVMVFWSYVLTFAAIVLTAIVLISKNVLKCQQFLIPLILPIPVIGAVFSNLAMARMSLTLNMLLAAGVDAMRSVQQSFLSTGNDYYISGMKKSLAEIQSGTSLAGSLESAKVFPNEFIEGIEVGELSGSETESLEFLATEYDRRAKSALTALSVLASTLVWLFIAGLIIFIIIRMAMQYVKMLQSFMP